MKTLIVNANTNDTITLNTEATTTQQWEQAKAEGCDLGKTSFYYLVSGKTQASKGWSVQQVEETKVEEKPAPVKVFGMTFKPEQIVATNSEGNTAPRRRRDMSAIFESANKSAHNEWVQQLEELGFQLCDIKNGLKKFRFNVPGAELGRKSQRIDISPLKNGGFNFTLYKDNRATDTKFKLSKEDATVANIVAAAQRPEFQL